MQPAVLVLKCILRICTDHSNQRGTSVYSITLSVSRCVRVCKLPWGIAASTQRREPALLQNPDQKAIWQTNSTRGKWLNTMWKRLGVISEYSRHKMKRRRAGIVFWILIQDQESPETLSHCRLYSRLPHVSIFESYFEPRPFHKQWLSLINFKWNLRTESTEGEKS